MARRLFGTDRQRERATQQALTTRVENTVAVAFRRQIAGTMRAAADAVRDGAGVVDVVDARSEDLTRLLQRTYTAAANALGGRVLEALKGVHGEHWVRKQEPDLAFQAALQAFITSTVAGRIEDLDNTTKAQLQAIVRRGIAEGETLNAIRDRIRATTPIISGVRAATIARTETHSAAQFGHLQAAVATDLPLVKEWISAQDDRTREDPFDHLGSDGQTVGIALPFDISGDRLMQPGDPNGSPGNVINCRCGAGFLLED